MTVPSPSSPPAVAVARRRARKCANRAGAAATTTTAAAMLAVLALLLAGATQSVSAASVRRKGRPAKAGGGAAVRAAATAASAATASTHGGSTGGGGKARQAPRGLEDFFAPPTSAPLMNQVLGVLQANSALPRSGTPGGGPKPKCKKCCKHPDLKDKDDLVKLEEYSRAEGDGTGGDADDDDSTAGSGKGKGKGGGGRNRNRKRRAAAITSSTRRKDDGERGPTKFGSRGLVFESEEKQPDGPPPPPPPHDGDGPPPPPPGDESKAVPVGPTKPKPPPLAGPDHTHEHTHKCVDCTDSSWFCSIDDEKADEYDDYCPEGVSTCSDIAVTPDKGETTISDGETTITFPNPPVPSPPETGGGGGTGADKDETNVDPDSSETTVTPTKPPPQDDSTGGGMSPETEDSFTVGTTPTSTPSTLVDLNTANSCGQKVNGTTSPVRVAFIVDVVSNGTDVEDYFEDNTYKAAGFCPDDRRRRLSLLLARALEDSGTLIGAEKCPPRNGIPSKFTVNPTPYDVCSGLSVDSDNNEECGQYKGEFCGYCDANVTSNYDCGVLGLAAMQAGIANLVDPAQGIIGVQYRGGDISTLVTSTGNGAGAGDGDGAGITAINVGPQSSSADEPGLSNVGKGLIAGAVVGLVLVAFLAVRRKKSSQTKEVGFLDDEDLYSTGSTSDKIPFSPGDSLDGTEKMSDVGSPASSRWRKARPGHVVGESDSVVTDTGAYQYGETMDMTELQLAEGDGAGAADATVDVHRCASATCEICSARKARNGDSGANGPTFVSSALEDLEIDSDAVNRSVNSTLSYASRSYPMEDTVDF